jgi:adenylate cyclase
VNLASRLEAVNKIYGTGILLAASTRERAGATIVAREIDRVAVYGKAEGVVIFELLGMVETRPGPEIDSYERALGLYREREFQAAIDALGGGAEGGPGRWLAARCRQLLTDPPGPDWQPLTQLDMK